MSRSPRGATAFLLALSLSSTAGAQEVDSQTVDPQAVHSQPKVESIQPWGSPRQWKYAEFSTADYWTTGISSLVAVGFYLVPPRPQHVLSVPAFDREARDFARGSSEQRRQISRDVSDIFLALSTAQPFIDSLVVAGWYRQSPEVARQLSLISAQTMGVTNAIVSMTKFAVSRERPYGVECGGELPAETIACESNDRFRSFMSGHTAQTFSAAALACTQHVRFELYGDAGATAPCVGGFVLAGATGYFRMAGDSHYASDVLAGAVTGASVGFLLPWLLHYRFEDSTSADAVSSITLVPQAHGAQLQGTF